MFLEVLRDPVDLVCSRNRGNGSCRLDVHPKRGSSLCRLNAHRKESGLMHQREDNLMHRRDNGLVHRRHSRFARLIINATRLRLSFFSLLVSAVLNWSVTHLFDSLGRPNRLCELNIWPDSCR